MNTVEFFQEVIYAVGEYCFLGTRYMQNAYFYIFLKLFFQGHIFINTF